jgi:cryptochrome
MAGVWFRKGLRLHDNAALSHAVAQGEPVFPFFILDPWFDRSRIGVNRFQFLLESLQDLDTQLREQHHSRLLVLRGSPESVLKDLFDGAGPFKLKSLFWEKDTEPYAMERDAKVEALAKKMGIETQSFVGHTLLDVELVAAASDFKAPISMRDIQKIMDARGPIAQPLPVPSIPPLEWTGLSVPSISELYDEAPTSTVFPGGEREALRRLASVCSDVAYVCNFEKPKTASTGRPGMPEEPSTTGLSPYFKFGCVSVRTAWWSFAKCQQGRRHSQPPQSLHGQLLFREMFYILSVAIPNWDKDHDNPMCKCIPWGEDATFLSAWENGRTGYPFIDALMRQLRLTGHMHHLGRHAVACFLTRGDLWQNWTKGRDVFDKYLLDADWALNNGNWLWLAGVAPFSAPYFRVYDPCPGGNSSLNAEQSGDFVRHFVPEVAHMPAKYIYKPWTAPLGVQQKAKCIIGKDYPAPIVDHKIAREANLQRFKEALEVLKSGQLPAKFGAAQKDPGPMKAKMQSTLTFPAFEKKNGADHDIVIDSSQEGESTKRLAGNCSAPQPKRRWAKKVV